MDRNIHFIGNAFELVLAGIPEKEDRPWGEHDDYLKTFYWWKGFGTLKDFSDGKEYPFTFETFHSGEKFGLFESIVFIEGYGAYGRSEQEILSPEIGTDILGKKIVEHFKNKKTSHIRFNRFTKIELEEAGVIANKDGQIFLPL